mmetsp:Transcript_33272/g.48920  ORF Transcript_33272/g.48920 Transcript_33272/m.48920 type:complete len:300 (+) Transcript_33272:409-1308(+)|eukprot:CAMPEP_0195507706 /NCGR_PEP_ID=MMETSP0794_2-20130614/1096_1 /TAXON_ID=515487 /ORGANISM="Stephanopyxis turris, Strain CCMP 815" /LENGTH=299 /DNA_ID=CAMNT_0040634477 /DNA_START=364 /DNA_END=1263 /DNA_ORIENTATION=+
MADDDYIAGNDDDYKVCKVYDGDDRFTVAVQIFLGVVALGSLWIKRLREKPQRDFETWFLDVSKQGVGATYAHVLNMAIAAVIANNVRGDGQLEDECAWYAINYLYDTSVGLLVSIAFLRLLDILANKYDWTSLKDSGVYVGPTAYTHWAYQITAWLVILTLTKVVIFFMMWISSDWLAFWGAVLFGPFESNTRVELVFVMILFPGILNIIYFWIVDSYLQADGNHQETHENDLESIGGGTDRKTALISVEDNHVPRSPKETDGLQTDDERKTSGSYVRPDLNNAQSQATSREHDGNMA